HSADGRIFFKKHLFLNKKNFIDHNKKKEKCMKAFYIIVFILVLLNQNVKAINPSYTLTSHDYLLTCSTLTSLEFSIYIRSNDSQTPFEYASGQYYFDLNPYIANGGTFSAEIVSSDLPLNVRPTIVGVSGSRLVISANSPPGAGNGFIVPVFPGVKVATIRLNTSSTSFSGNSFYFPWRTGPSIPFTKIFAYVNSVLTEIAPVSAMVEESYCQMFTNSPWECCNAKLVSLTSVTEGLYNPNTGTVNRNDTFAIEVRQFTSPYSLISTGKCLKNGFSSFHAMPAPFFQPQYLVVKHHNSLEIWSKIPYLLPRNGDSLSFDILHSDTNVYGNNEKLVGTKYCMFSGDVNQDRVIDAEDNLLTYNDVQILATGYVQTDVNGDNITDSADLTIVYNNAINFKRVVSPLEP
ncbi:MAG: hypothetical protein ABI528_08390, partial [bacterium]